MIFAGTCMDVHIGVVIWPEAAPNLLYLSAPLKRKLNSAIVEEWVWKTIFLGTMPVALDT